MTRLLATIARFRMKNGVSTDLYECHFLVLELTCPPPVVYQRIRPLPSAHYHSFPSSTTFREGSKSVSQPCTIRFVSTYTRTPELVPVIDRQMYCTGWLDTLCNVALVSSLVNVQAQYDIMSRASENEEVHSDLPSLVRIILPDRTKS
jgi:hypothetical protein